MLKANMCFSPFMGDNKPLSVGLNPLGIRTASEQLFTTLLPGLNVVTLRVRYYSFYCWLLKSFYETRDEAKQYDFQRYIRMSELLLALIHAQSNNSGGVPGITRASEIIAKGEEVINFNEDAMPNGSPSDGYWKGHYGAFGTYYAASLQEMGIIRPLEDNTNLYNVTQKNEKYIGGEALAEAFEESVGKEMGGLFKSCANAGIVTRKQLAEMEPYFQSHNLPENFERKLLLQMLLQNDRPYLNENSYLRKDSLRLLLTYLDDKNISYFSELEFAKHVYDSYNQGNEDSLAAVGWYAYYLNDSRQYEALNIFDEILDRLQESKKPGQWENIDEFTSELSQEVCRSFNSEGQTLEDLLNNWESISEPSEKMAHAFYIILDNYKKNPNYKQCKSIMRQFYHKVSNDALDYFDEIERSFEVPLFLFIKRYLTENIIYNHYSESMRKYSQNGIPTQKIAIENGYVRGLATYSATHSSPRIDTLRNYATDLGLIQNYNVMPPGKELLNSLRND